MKNTVFDPLRRKEVPLTPEENVRQQLIRWLNSDRGVPMTLMASEYSLSLNKMNIRADIVVFDKEGKPLFVIECKAPSVKLDQEVVDQVVRYNIVLKSKYLMITNGNESILFKYDGESGKYECVDDVPEYNQMMDGSCE